MRADSRRPEMLLPSSPCPQDSHSSGFSLDFTHDRKSSILNSFLLETDCPHTHVCAVLSHSYMSNSLQPHGLQPTRLLCPWDSPGKKTGVGCHAFLQGIFPTQGLNPGLPHCRQIFYQLSSQGSPSLIIREMKMKMTVIYILL